MGERIQPGDRIVWDGRIFNEVWDPDTEGTVVAIRGHLADVRWDHGATCTGYEVRDLRRA